MSAMASVFDRLSNASNFTGQYAENHLVHENDSDEDNYVKNPSNL